MKSQLERLRETLHASIDGAIDGVIKSGLQPAKPPGRIPRHDPMTSPHRFFSAIDFLAEVQDKLKGEFTVHDAKRYVEESNSRAKLSQSAYSAALADLVKQGYLQVVIPGSGRRPSTYRMIQES